ncbi:MAG: phytoene desaturase family protein [Streptosporangiaceae bacterium]
MSRTVDAVVIGSGHNALVAAAYLARAGWEVEVYERNPVPGGYVATEELTLPGFRHDTFSSWHPLFQLSATFAELGDELAARGLAYRNTDLPAASVRPDGSTVLGYREPERTAKRLPGRDSEAYLQALASFGAHADLVGELMGSELFSTRAAWLAARLVGRLGRIGTLDFVQMALGSARSWLDVERILVEHGRAVGVRAGGEEIRARRTVVANVTPNQLYGRLLGPDAPARQARAATRYRYGRGGMQIHMALTEPVRWHDPTLGEAAIVHVSGGSDTVAIACAQARAGQLPAEPTIVCGQPTTLDQTRAPQGRAVLWVQLQEVPYAPCGDAAGQLEPDERWTDDLKARYAERVLGLIGRHASNIPDAVLAHSVLSPTDLEARNINLVRGDPYAGDCELDQSYLWRSSHKTPIRGLYHCGASTYPGPGLGAASGRIVARHLLSRTTPRMKL